MDVYIGERGVVYPFAAKNADGTSKDLTGYTLKLYIYDDDKFSNIDSSRSGTLTDSVNGKYKYTSAADGADWTAGSKKASRLGRWLWQNDPNNPTVLIWSEEFPIFYHQTPPTS